MAWSKTAKTQVAAPRSHVAGSQHAGAARRPETNFAKAPQKGQAASRVAVLLASTVLDSRDTLRESRTDVPTIPSVDDIWICLARARIDLSHLTSRT